VTASRMMSKHALVTKPYSSLVIAAANAFASISAVVVARSEFLSLPMNAIGGFSAQLNGVRRDRPASLVLS
jgi:hypothetical protein